ncbi:WYL domain-containing protein [Paucibacter sp. B2R-40]|uniref:helix-turn-helix transcriptional regulator n=1 Tax=Paucibacter sp. B2R-40 TaxID=2893554 RepID=UPI0021E4C36B|nr:WYL domain-containing protein [Paucibacter sp. B2R-40]MCV2356541.1 WYL domain-containing protein [Paucibacter sp. B2R-40]
MTAPKPAPKHDTLVRRLVQILIKLNHGEKLSPIALSSEFNVDLRTIQRDLNERFAYLNLEKAGGYYSLDPVFLGKLSTRDIDRFAGLAGIKGLFPSFSDDFLRDIFDSRIQSALLVKGHNYEELHDDENQYFQQLEGAIASRHRVSFSFKKDEGDKQYADLDPYKLVNNKGIWYLAAKDNGKLKTFSFTKISRLMVSKTVFDHDASIEKALTENDGIWMNETRREIVLKVAKEVAGYFKRRKLIANQVIEKELENGALILSAKVGHLNQILPIVRYWIPHIQIISPDHLQNELNQELSDYLKKTQ